MKFEIRLGNINIQGIELKNVELKANYSLNDCIGAYELARRVIKELPETLEDLKAGALKFDEIDKEFCDVHKEEVEDLSSAVSMQEEANEDVVKEEVEEEKPTMTIESLTRLLERNYPRD